MKQRVSRNSQLLASKLENASSSSDQGSEEDRYDDMMNDGKDDDDEDGNQIEFLLEKDFEAKFRQDLMMKKMMRFDKILDDI